MLAMSVLEGETLNTVADVIAWLVLILVPVIGLTIFWIVHILPEKIAERKKHPQAKAIQTLCLLSLVFGGILWPLAWLWAYTKPVLHKMAYGTDVDEHGHGSHAPEPAEAAAIDDLKRARERLSALAGNGSENPQIAATIQQISALEAQLAGSAAAAKGGVA